MGEGEEGLGTNWIMGHKGEGSSRMTLGFIDQLTLGLLAARNWPCKGTGRAGG